MEPCFDKLSGIHIGYFDRGRFVSRHVAEALSMHRIILNSCIDLLECDFTPNVGEEE